MRIVIGASLVALVALNAVVAVKWVESRTRAGRLEKEVRQYREDRREVCDLAAFIVDGSARVAGQPAPLRPEDRERLLDDLGANVLHVRGCVVLPAATVAATEQSGESIPDSMLQAGILALDQEMKAAAARGWPPLARSTIDPQGRPASPIR